jgi:succinyl-CoA synthetase beta subunit
MIMYSTEGGMDIEEVAEPHPLFYGRNWSSVDKVFKQEIAFNLGSSGNAFKEMENSSMLYIAYIVLMHHVWNQTQF